MVEAVLTTQGQYYIFTAIADEAVLGADRRLDGSVCLHHSNCR